MLRPVLVLLAGGLVSACGSADGDPVRFETMARRVAEIPVEGRPVATPAAQVDAAPGLRPAISPDMFRTEGLKVQVMDPHDLWDARDGLRRPLASAEPLLQHTVQTEAAVDAVVVRPEIKPLGEAPRGARATIQLGAFSSPEAARAAWDRVSKGRAQAALVGLSPDFVPVQVNGRSVVRVRVSAPAATAAAICQAAQVADPWCLRGA